jgi:hypothetical protein
MAHMASDIEDQIASHSNSAKFCRLSGRENPVHKIPPSWGKRMSLVPIIYISICVREYISIYVCVSQLCNALCCDFNKWRL